LGQTYDALIATMANDVALIKGDIIGIKGQMGGIKTDVAALKWHVVAAAGDWDAVAGYQCNGVNSYAKMVRQYRDRLVAAHKAQQAAATEQGAAQ
jgi:hypothetical protein